MYPILQVEKTVKRNTQINEQIKDLLKNSKPIHHEVYAHKRNIELKYNYGSIKTRSHSQHHSYSQQHSHNYNHNNAHNHKHKKVLEFDRNFELYLEDIEKITHKKIMPIQRQELKYHIDNFEYTRLSSEEAHEHRREFNRHKKEIIAEWELMTGRKWDTYDEPVYSKSGKVVRQVGDRFDLHHILECSWGGDNVWWNSHPARHPDEHNQQIHRKNGFADKIFN